MERNELFDRLNAVFQDVFDDPGLTVSDATVADDVDGWDSLVHITLMQAVEDEFGIRMAMKEIVNLKNVGALADIIQARG